MTFSVLSDVEALPNKGLRSYEVFQRERVREGIGSFPPRLLLSEQYLRDPHSVVASLREQFACYRDWVGNAFWVTRYDDVTSVFADDANFVSRPKRWVSGGAPAGELTGRDLGAEPMVRAAWVAATDEHAGAVASDLIAELADAGHADLALDIAARFPLELLARVLGVPTPDTAKFAALYLGLQRSVEWGPEAAWRGLQAADRLSAYVAPLLEQRRREPLGDLISTFASLELDGPPVKAADVVVTLLEGDHETLHGSLANMWFLLLTHPDQLAEVTAERRLVKSAYLETLRHSPPVVAASRFTRHEVERFGRLLPDGAMVVCSAAAANRDPRVFDEPDRFSLGRKDLCQREPRGQYRADGLATGISFGSGRPSVYPAVPEDRPRSAYAQTRDLAVRVTNQLLDAFEDIRLSPGPSPQLRSLRFGSMHTCWALPVTFGVSS